MSKNVQITVENSTHKVTIERVDGKEYIDFHDVMKLVDNAFQGMGFEI